MQAAEATSKLAAANAKMGYAATATSSFNQQLPCILAAAPLRLYTRHLLYTLLRPLAADLSQECRCMAKFATAQPALIVVQQQHFCCM